MKDEILRKFYIGEMCIRILFKNIPNKKIWIKAFTKYFADDRYGYNLDTESIFQKKKQLLQGFLTKNIKLVKRISWKEQSESDKRMPIVICVVKNEREKLSYFFSHYRKLGIKRFVFLDNMSTDGTMDFLRKQKDVDIFEVNEPFCGYIKEGWINQILARYGFYQWYLVADADELLVWPQIGKRSLIEMLDILSEKKLYRPLAIMLDMYSDDLLYQDYSDNIFEKYCYFDKSTYYWMDSQMVNILSGGPRKRILKSEVWLSKTPLFFFRPLELMCCAHYMYPYQRFQNPKCPLVLLHYKFAYQGSFSKMREYVKEGIDINRIDESRACIQKKGLKFFYEDSVCLDSIKELDNIQYVADIEKYGMKKVQN